jgi:hypothetical protein
VPSALVTGRWVERRRAVRAVRLGGLPRPGLRHVVATQRMRSRRPACGTSSEKRRLAQTREELRDAGEDALRMASAHETPTETPIYGPGNIFDTGDDDHDDGDEIETLREANADLKRRLRKYNSESTVGAATRLLIRKPHVT